MSARLKAALEARGMSKTQAALLFADGKQAFVEVDTADVAKLCEGLPAELLPDDSHVGDMARAVKARFVGNKVQVLVHSLYRLLELTDKPAPPV